MIRKICVVITSRPSYSRIKMALVAIKRHPDLHLQLVVTGSALLEKYGRVIHQIENDGFEIDDKLFNILEGNDPVTSAKTTGLAMIELSTLLARLQPDMVITIADRYETLANAAAAAYINIPLVHIQGGEITGNIDEKVRHAVTQLSDFHFVASENAKARVLRMRDGGNNVYNTGCPSIDIAALVANQQTLDFDPFAEYGGVGPTFDHQKGYLVVMQHPVTNEYQSAQNQILYTCEAIATLGLPTFWFWPNPDSGTEEIAKGLRTFREVNPDLPIHFFKNMEPVHFLKLLKNASCLIGNSSVGIRECAFLGIPVVNIGRRQTGRERGANVIDVDHNVEAISNAITFQIAHGAYQPDFMYGKGNSGEKIASLLATLPLNSLTHI